MLVEVAAQDAVVAVKRMQANTEELPTNFDGAGAWRDKTLMWIREKEVSFLDPPENGHFCSIQNW